MKKLITSVLFFIALISKGQTIDIPDNQFRLTLCLAGFDKSGDMQIQVNEALAVDSLNLSSLWISSLKGIEEFKSLRYLNCSGNQILSLDVNNCAKLKYLNCSGNLLFSINTSGCIFLHYLNCSGNKLMSLDVSKNINLKSLECGANPFTTLDVSKNIRLQDLYCISNKLTSLDVSQNDSLMGLSCYFSSLATLNLGNINLYYLNCERSQLTTLNLSNNKRLAWVYINNNQLTNLDLSGCANLYTLYCDHNKLTALDVRYNTKLSQLDCSYNNIKMICINKDQVKKSWRKDIGTSLVVDCIVSIPDIEKLKTEHELVKIYNLLGQEVTSEQKKEGVYILQYSDGTFRRKWYNEFN